MVKQPSSPPPIEGSTDHVIGVFEGLRRRIEGFHMPDFLGIDITMSQAKIVLLLVSHGELHLSRLGSLMGVSLPTISGHVDRLVEQRLAGRRDDPADRRQVLVTPTPAAVELAERFHNLNVTRLRRLLDRMTAEERLDVARAFEHIARAVESQLGDEPVTPVTPDTQDRTRKG